MLSASGRQPRTLMIRKAAALIVLLICAACAYARARGADLRANSFYEVRVERVVDGDTIIVRFPDKARERVRLIGVNTPESVAPDRPVERYGKEASRFTEQALSGQTVILQTDAGTRDKYDRALAYVWMETPSDPTSEDVIRAKMFNARLLLEGFAQVMTIQPNVANAELFVKLQGEARRAERGLWTKEKK